MTTSSNAVQISRATSATQAVPTSDLRIWPTYARALIFSAVSLIALTSQAQTVGDRAVGLGGAYTALADDPSAVWYNPAGLARLSGHLVSGSGNVYKYRSLRYSNFMRLESGPSNPGVSDFEGKSVTVIPSSLAYGMGFEAGGLRHGVGLAVLVPEATKGTGRIAVKNGANTLGAAFLTTEESRDYYFALGYAAGSTSWRAGLSLMLRVFDRDYDYNYFTYAEDAPGNIPDDHIHIETRVYNETYQHLSFIPALGAQVDLPHGLKLGLMAALPSLALWGRADVLRVMTEAGPEKVSDGDSHLQDPQKANPTTILKRPYIIRVGLGYDDGGAVAGEISAELSGKIDPYFDRSPRLPESTEADLDRVSKRFGIDLALGAELRLSESSCLRGGLFTKRAHHDKLSTITSAGSTPAARRKAAVRAGEHYEDAYGLNLAVGLGPKGAQSSYGIRIVRGTGEALGLVTQRNSRSQPGDPYLLHSAEATSSTYWEVAFVVTGTLGTDSSNSGAPDTATGAGLQTAAAEFPRSP